jgi:DNA-binding response OmpR family regulator
MSYMKILIVEDDNKMRKVLKRSLADSGYLVDAVDNGATALEFALTNIYDLIILDIGLPEINGIEVCRKIRGKPVSSFILMLTGRNELNDKISGLDAGADDYLCKPFEYEELEARIRALCRREPSISPQVTESNGITVNRTTREVTVNNRNIELTATEYRLLEYFMQNPNCVLTNCMLEEKIWDTETAHEYDAVKVYVSRLRHKLGFEADNCPIQNIYGEGYKFTP